MNKFESALGLALILISLPHQNLGVTHGWEATPHSVPYLAYILIDEALPSHTTCTGTLITSNYVLTSSYCTYRTTSLTVVLGAHNISENEETQIRVGGRESVTHNLYNASRYDFDIGLIMLSHGVETNEFINFAILPDSPDANITGLYSATYGWGITSHGFYCERPDVLMEVQNAVLVNWRCNELYGEISDRENALCFSGDTGTGICQGDQGGPLVFEGVQHGVGNYFSPGCTKEYPSVFTRVASFLDWIELNSDWRRPV